MPNWCDNRLEITGPAEDIATIAQRCRCSEKRFDFNGIVPMPESLEITCGSATDCGYDALYGDWKRVVGWLRSEELAQLGVRAPKTRKELVALLESNPDRFNAISLDLGRKARANEDAHGHKTWYSWCIEHWGTKWNSGEDLDVEVEATAITAWFQTAWSPPVPVIEALCKQFPRVSVEMHYYEEGMFFGGTLAGANGAVEDQPTDDVKSFAESAFDAVFEDDE